jgi:heme exporter protein D
VHLPTLIEKVAPGRSCVHKPMREILQELHREQAEQAHIRDAREDAHG